MIILSEGPVCDGYDIRIQLSNGDTTFVHFAKSAPTLTEITDLCNQVETQMLDALITDEEAANAEEAMA